MIARFSLLSVAVTVLAASPSFASKYKIRWVIAHEPAAVFERAAKHFSDEVREASHGEIEVEVLSSADFARERRSKLGDVLRNPISRRNRKKEPKKMSPGEVVRSLAKGEIQMSQTYTTTLSRLHEPLRVLDLPYLFRDHDHATKVLDGAIGKRLLAGLTRNSIRGLAFTYSGGYRVLPALAEIRRLEDLHGKRVRVAPSPVTQAYFRRLGAEPVVLPVDAVGRGLETGSIDIGESTYARIDDMDKADAVRVINETNHSLFLTSIIMNEEFFRSLPSRHRKIIRRAASEAARIEREQSVADNKNVRRRARRDGIQVRTLSRDERERWEKAAQPVYAEFGNVAGEGVVEEILSLR